MLWLLLTSQFGAARAQGFVDCIEGLGGYLLVKGDIEIEILTGNSTAIYTSDLYFNSPGSDIYLGSSRDIGRKTVLKTGPVLSELPLYIFVRDTFDTFHIGDGGFNPDGVPHSHISSTLAGILEQNITSLTAALNNE